MAIAHVCTNCGTSLTRIFAPPDPIYGLAIVVCPGCRAAAVRRRPQATVVWRKFCRLWTSARAGAFGALSAVVIIGGTAGLAAGQQAMLHDAGMSVTDFVRHWSGADPIPDAVDSWRANEGPVLAIVAFAWCMICGVVLGAVLPHVRSRMALWAGVGVGVVALIWLPASIDFVDTVGARGVSSFRAEPERQITTIALAACGLMLLAMPLGMRLRRRIDARPPRRIARLRSRIRARRSRV